MLPILGQCPGLIRAFLTARGSVDSGLPERPAWGSGKWSWWWGAAVEWSPAALLVALFRWRSGRVAVMVPISGHGQLGNLLAVEALDEKVEDGKLVFREQNRSRAEPEFDARSPQLPAPGPRGPQGQRPRCSGRFRGLV